MRGEFPAGHDSPAHLTYTYLFDHALSEGQFPVRWIEWVKDGLGHPLFNFYQPGLYYLVQAVHLAVPSLNASLKLTVLLLWWLGAAFTYLSFSRMGRLPAAAAAVTFTFSPYLVLDVFVRAAYPELAGITFGVGVFWALDRWIRTRRYVWLPVLAALSSLMLISHPPASLIFVVLFAFNTSYLLITRQTTMRVALGVVPAMLLGAGLAAFYVLPAIAELHLIRSGELTRGGYDYHHHFVTARQWWTYTWGSGGSVAGSGDGMSFQIGIAQWMAIAVALGVVATSLVRRTLSSRSQEIGLWLSVIAAAMFFMTRPSVTVWEIVGPLAYVQFPWRFLMLISIGAAGLTAALLSLTRNRRLQVALVIGVVALQVQLAHSQLKPKGYITKETIDIDWWDWRHSEVAEKSAYIEHGYLPASLHLPEVPDGRWTVMHGSAEVREVVGKAHELVLQVTAHGPARLRINTPAFPGWRVLVDDEPAAARVIQGYPVLSLEPGTHRVHAAFQDTPIRRAANVISLFSGVCLLAASGLAKRVQR